MGVRCRRLREVEGVGSGGRIQALTLDHCIVKQCVSARVHAVTTFDGGSAGFGSDGSSRSSSRRDDAATVRDNSATLERDSPSARACRPSAHVVLFLRQVARGDL